MKRTGPLKIETQKLITALEKHAKKTKQGIFAVLAEELSRPRRSRVAINLKKISKTAAANSKKIIVVPGKVLSYGDALEGIEIAAFDFSEEARKKVLQAKGKAINFKQLMEKKASEMLLVK